MRTRFSLAGLAALVALACNIQKASVRAEAGTVPITPPDPAPAQPGADSEPPVALQPSETRPAPAKGRVKRESSAAPNAAPAEKPRVAPAAEPKKAETEQQCKACGGVWAKHGLSKTPSCNCATSDGGRRCKDGAECEGICAAADEPELEVVEKGPPARGFFVGRCSKNVAIFGCYRPIERGASATPVDLTPPPQMICAE
jgi:hypothetical protein